ncbi:MAG: ParB/RepB/Spo0J family partition protein [Cyanobacteria bacterium P01_D01_bin.56]
MRSHSKQPVAVNKPEIQDDKPSTEGLVQQLPWSLIVLPEKQPRRYFDEVELEKLAVSIREHGILTPLLVRPKGADQYELVAGERRYRAAKNLKLAEVPVLIREMMDNEAVELALLENLQREDLNPVEETEAILDLLSQRLKMSRETVISLLNRGANRKRKSVQNVLHSSEWQLVEQLFRAIGRFTPQSFRASRLPLLKLPEEILTALRQGTIEYTKAQAIARLKEPQDRGVLLKDAISSQLSLNQIKQRIQKLKANQQQLSRLSAFQQRWKQINIQLGQKKLWEQPEIGQELERIMDELERVIAGTVF